MTATDLTQRPLRELARHVAGGVETTLSWDEDTDALTATVTATPPHTDPTQPTTTPRSGA